MVQNFQLPSYPILFQKPKENGEWSTTGQEAYGVYYAITKWNYYLQGAAIIVRNDHKPLTKFLNGKNANNKVYRWGIELATYNITFEWISGARNKAAFMPSGITSIHTSTDQPTIHHKCRWTSI